MTRAQRKNGIVPLQCCYAADGARAPDWKPWPAIAGIPGQICQEAPDWRNSRRLCCRSEHGTRPVTRSSDSEVREEEFRLPHAVSHPALPETADTAIPRRLDSPIAFLTKPSS